VPREMVAGEDLPGRGGWDRRIEGVDLSNAEIRVLGCLLEKQRTTPDHYPLSLNSLRLACNQSTNREPVVDYDEAIIRDALHRLERRGYTRLAGASRAAKYRHLLAEALPMSNGEQAAMCVLMLRGPQTPGELKQRGERIHTFEGLDEVHATLAALVERGLVARLDRRPGQKEERYQQLLGVDAEPETSGAGAPGWGATPAVASVSAIPTAPSLSERVAQLEREVVELRAALAESRRGTREEERRGEREQERRGEREGESVGESEQHSTDSVESGVAGEQGVSASWRSESAAAP
jgi:uncharacterized protein YceH (UPF0502 family)